MVMDISIHDKDILVIISDVKYEIFYILPITIIGNQIYHDM